MYLVAPTFADIALFFLLPCVVAKCAVLGGNLDLLKWLVDEHCCPLRSIRISHGKEKDSQGSYTPILTSKGRSLLGIALSNRNIGIVRYLVAEKRMLLSAEKGLSVDTLVQNLDLVLRVLPEEVLGEQGIYETAAKTDMKDDTVPTNLSTTATNSVLESSEDRISDNDYADIGAGRQSGEGDLSSSEEVSAKFDYSCFFDKWRSVKNLFNCTNIHANLNFFSA